jgi:hypothetical protein
MSTEVFWRKSIKKAQEVSCKLPRTMKQIESARRMGKAVKTLRQRIASRNNGKHGKLSKDTIIQHHNDLCHGAERPDDITCMSHGGHSRLHAKLRYPYREKDSKGRFM